MKDRNTSAPSGRTKGRTEAPDRAATSKVDVAGLLRTLDRERLKRERTEAMIAAAMEGRTDA